MTDRGVQVAQVSEMMQWRMMLPNGRISNAKSEVVLRGDAVDAMLPIYGSWPHFNPPPTRNVLALCVRSTLVVKFLRQGDGQSGMVYLFLHPGQPESPRLDRPSLALETGS